MTKTEKLALIGKFESAYSIVETQIKGLSAAELRFVPALPDAWSINDFLVHFLDADMSMAFRLRAAVAEPGFAVPVWNEEAWQARLHYDEEDGRARLKEAEALRARLAAFVRRIVDKDWDELYVMHPSRGRVDLAALLDMYRDHIAFHAPLIRRNLDAQRAAGAKRP
jgi:hypothetical protein